MDGNTSEKLRNVFFDLFNKKNSGYVQITFHLSVGKCHVLLFYRPKLFLISTKAGNLGINLVAASRVILFDPNWNPAQDCQAIGRTFRFGQTKPTFVYRLIGQGSMEEKMYDRQVEKLSLSSWVIDKESAQRSYSKDDVQDFFKFIPDIDETCKFAPEPLHVNIMLKNKMF